MPAKVFNSNPFLPQLFSFLSLTISLFFTIFSSNPEMGNKKLKDPETNDTQSVPVAPQPSISTILSGDVTDKNAAASIFSDENPSLKKPQQQQTVEASDIPDYGSAQQKNRKRKGEPAASPGFDYAAEAVETQSDIQKSKKGKLKSSDLEGGDGDGDEDVVKEEEENKNKLEDPETNDAQSVPVAPQPSISKIPDYGNAEQKSRKRKGAPAASPGFDSTAEAAETQSDIQKSKKGKLTSPDLEGGDGYEDVVKEEEEENKKKRKREEIEKEYEAIKYGAVGDNAGEEEKRLGWKVGEKRKALENPEDDLVPKEGFDDESKLLRTVFVGNLPLSVKKKALIKEFNKFGEVESVTVRIRSMPITDTKTPRKGAVFKKQVHEVADSVHACIVFKTEESAQASLSHNMPVIGDHHIRVDRAFPPHKQKRLTIANRKAKANAPKEIGSSKQAGAKRTMDSHTAESFFKKKAKNLR